MFNRLRNILEFINEAMITLALVSVVALAVTGLVRSWGK